MISPGRIYVGAPTDRDLSARARGAFPSRPGSRSRFTDQLTQCLIHGAVVWEGLRNFWFENHDIGRLRETPGILSTDKLTEVRALVLPSQLARRLPVNLLHRSLVAWYNTRRLLEPLGYVPPDEFEWAYYNRQAASAELAILA
jgi:hypothetical protein